MSEVYFRKNGTTYHLDYRTSSLFLCEAIFAFSPYKSSGYYNDVPAMSTQNSAVYSGGKDPYGRKVYYNTSSPTIAFRKNGTTYYCSKELKFAGKTSGSIVSTSVSSIKLSSHYYEKDITVNFKLSKTSSDSGVPSPKYELKYSVITNRGLVYYIHKSGDSWSGTTQNASYSSVLEIGAYGGNPSATVVIRFELWDALNENKIASKDVTLTGSWTWSDSSSGGGGSGGE